MGQLITQFTYQRRTLPEVEFMVEKSLSKIEEFYAKYRAISDSFAIDDTQFKQIFGVNHPLFDLLDTRKNLLIDGLQLFSGMTLFSKIVKFDLKIEFIFKLFDFNELNSLSITDLQFMFLSCCSVVYKLLGIKTALRQQQIVEFVHQEFQENRRINISEIKKWANKSELLKQFLVVISNFDMKNEEIFSKQQKSYFSQKIYLNSHYYNHKNYEDSTNEDQSIDKRRQDLQKWLHHTGQYFEVKQTNKISEYDRYYHCDVQVKPNWIYGIRYKDLKYFIEFVNQNQIAYFVGKVAILLNLKSNKQRHYLQHKNSILAIAHRGDLIATSQDTSPIHKIPEIRIWNAGSLATMGIIKGLHSSGIHLLRFSKCGNMLLSASNQRHSPIAIYQMNKTFDLIYSCYSEYPTVEIALTFSFTNQTEMNFVIASLYSIKCFCVDESSQGSIKVKQQFDIGNMSSNFEGKKDYLSPISCCSLLCINKNYRYLQKYDEEIERLIITGHENGQIYVWSFSQRSLLFKLGAENTEITHILPHQNYILISTNSSELTFWDIDLREKQKNQVIDMTTLVSQAESYEVANVIHDFSDNFLITTTAGNLIRMKKEKKRDNCLKYQIFGFKYQAKLIRNILNLGQSICYHKIISLADKEEIILFATHSGSIIAINALTHNIIMSWKIGEKIVCFDCYESQEGGLGIIAATAERRIYFNNNMVESENRLEMQKNIRFIKFCCESTGILAVGLDDSTLHFININFENKLKEIQNYPKKNDDNNMLRNLYEFANSLGNKKEQLIKQKPTQIINPLVEITIQNTVKKLRLSANVSHITVLEKKIIAFMCEDNKLYQLSLKDYFYKVVEEESQVSASLFKDTGIQSYYTLKYKTRFYKLPIIIGPSPKIIVAGSLDGSLNIWKNCEQIYSQNETKLSWHSSICSSISLTKNQSSMITCGVNDGMITQSSVLYFFLANRNIVEPGRSLISAQSNFEHEEDGYKCSNFCIFDEMLEREVLFSTFQNQITTEKYDQHLLIRGIEDENLRKLLKSFHNDWNSINKQCDKSKTPNLSLKLEHVYGSETSNKRNTILTFSNPFRIAYFISNVVIVYNPPENSQSIYRGHRCRVTCIIKMNNSKIASGEAAYQACIHIWDTYSLETIRKISTHHTLGIINLNSENNCLLSYGICNSDKKIFCIEMHQISTGTSISFRKLQEALFSMAINPIKNNQFVTCSEVAITFWKIGNSHGKNFAGNIQKISVIDLESPITACFYRINSLVSCPNTKADFSNGLLDSELVIGTKSGALGIVTSKFKLIIINEKAHLKQINCISFINYPEEVCNKDEQQQQTFSTKYLTKNIKYIISCSEDETIKIWNRQFELLYEKQVRKIDFEENRSFLSISSSCLSNLSDKIIEKNISAQSISPLFLQGIDKQRQDRLKSKNDDRNSGVKSNGLFLVVGIRNGDIMIMKDYENITHTYQQIRGKSRQSRERKSLMKRNRSSKRTSFRKSRLKQMTEQVNKGQQHKKNPVSEKKNSVKAHNKDKCKPRQQKIKREELSFYLLLRNHSSQKSPSINFEYSNYNPIKVKNLFAHHPQFQLIVTISSDQNLLLWDTQRNILIMSRALSYMAEPTAIKFSKNGEILIIGHSDGSMLLLDFISEPGKGGEKYSLPSLKILKKIKEDEPCAVLNIEISDSGDYMAVSYNNKISKQTSKIIQGSHLKLYVNKSRQNAKKGTNNRLQFNDIFELKSKIPCQKVESHYITSQANKYGMSAYWMMFTESQGKTYLLIFEQLIDSNNKRLNYTKNGIYTLWDVSNSTVITTIDSSLCFNWKKLCIPNSLYCKYQLYGNLTPKDQSKIGCQDVGISTRNQDQYLFRDTQSINSNLLVPYMSAMINLPHHLILGSVNGDLHIAQASSLEYDQMIEHFPQKNQMFAAKTFPAHCSEINHIELNNHKNILYTSSVSQKSVFKWKIEGNSNTDMFNFFKSNNRGTKSADEQPENQLVIFQNADIFGEVPNFNQLETLQILYKTKNNLRIEKFLKGAYEIESYDYKEYINLIRILGRKAHDIRNNLFYDSRMELVYSSGHAIINKKLSQNSPKSIKNLHFLYTSNEREQLEQINLIQISKSRNFIYSCHKGVRACICIWQIFTKIRLKKIELFNTLEILQLRVSDNQNTGIIYGINFSKEPILMLIDFNEEIILGVTNFLNQPLWQIKDIVFYPHQSYQFITCGLKQTCKWQFYANQLVYDTLPSPFADSKNRNISICVSFTAKYNLVVTGCEDGSLAIWENGKNLRKDHSDMIMVLKSASPNILLGGTKDGFILMWMEENENLSFVSKISINCSHTSKQLFPSKTFKMLEKKSSENIEKKQAIAFFDSKEKKNCNNIIQSLDIFMIDNTEVPEQNRTAEEINFLESEMKKKDKIMIEENKQNRISLMKDKKKGKWKILIGTNSGVILQVGLQKKLHYPLEFQSNPETILHFYDQQIPKAFFFSKDDSRIFEITNQGHFFCRKLEDSAILFEHLFHLQTIDMLYSEKSQTFFCVFQSEIKLLSLKERNDSADDFDIKFHSSLPIKFITHATLSASGKLLAVCQKKNSDNTIVAIVFDVSTSNQPKQLMRFSVGKNESVQLIDFSKNNKIVLVKMMNGKFYIKDMFKPDNVIKQDAIRFIEWNDSAQKLFDLNLKILNKIDKNSLNEEMEGSQKQINDQFTTDIVKIEEISDNVYLLADIYGNVQVYKKCGKLMSRSNIRITQASMVRLSKSKKLIGVVSQIDRNIVIFDISLCLVNSL